VHVAQFVTITTRRPHHFRPSRCLRQNRSRYPSIEVPWCPPDNRRNNGSFIVHPTVHYWNYRLSVFSFIVTILFAPALTKTFLPSVIIVFALRSAFYSVVFGSILCSLPSVFPSFLPSVRLSFLHLFTPFHTFSHLFPPFYLFTLYTFPPFFLFTFLPFYLFTFYLFTFLPFTFLPFTFFPFFLFAFFPFCLFSFLPFCLLPFCLFAFLPFCLFAFYLLPFTFYLLPFYLFKPSTRLSFKTSFLQHVSPFYYHQFVSPSILENLCIPLVPSSVLYRGGTPRAQIPCKWKKGICQGRGGRRM
jgi:hypothetical protein